LRYVFQYSCSGDIVEGGRDAPEETTVSDRGMVTIPASLRRHLDIEAGDKLRGGVDEKGTSP
jgi:hypothetical protein